MGRPREWIAAHLFLGEGVTQRAGDSFADPAEAAEGTIRKTYANSIGENSVHGSDAPETAAEEIAFWFAGHEIVG